MSEGVCSTSLWCGTADWNGAGGVVVIGGSGRGKARGLLGMGFCGRARGVRWCGVASLWLVDGRVLVGGKHQRRARERDIGRA